MDLFSTNQVARALRTLEARIARLDDKLLAVSDEDAALPGQFQVSWEGEQFQMSWEGNSFR